MYHGKSKLGVDRIPARWYKLVFKFGGVAERLKAAVLKTVKCKSFVGSNPTSSAMKTIFCGEMAEWLKALAC